MENPEILDPADFVNFSKTLIDSLPYPAMYIRITDRVIVGANEIAKNYGAKIGEYCWRGYAKENFISAEDHKISLKYPQMLPIGLNVKCVFCKGNDCFLNSPVQENAEVHAFGKVWEAHWIKVSDDVFLHFMVDVSDKMQLLDTLRNSEFFLRQTQQIAMLGTYSFRIQSGEWICSDVLDQILGFDNKPNKNFEDWVNILHPDMKAAMIEYFSKEIIAKKAVLFDKEYKIVRNNDNKTIWVHGIGHLEYDKNGNPLSMIGAIRDITERKNEQASVTRNLKFTEVLLKSIPTPVFFKDTEGLYTGCNEAFTKQLGITSEFIKGKSVMELWPSDQAEVYHNSDLELLKSKEFQSYQARITDKNKQLRDVVYAKNVFYDESGEVAGIVGTFLDITEQKQIEYALRKSEEKLRTVANYTNDWEFWIDPEGVFLYCSPSCEKITGYTNEEFIENSDLFQKIIYYEDKPKYLKHKQSETEVKDDNTEIEFRIVRKDGAVRWIGHAYRAIYNEQGDYLGIRGSDRDITERKETEVLLKASEQKYKLLSENINDGIFTYRNGHLEYVNQSMGRIFGCKKTDLEGVRLSTLLAPSYWESFDEFLSEKVVLGKTKSIEVECLRMDNSPIYVDIYLNYLDEKNLAYGVLHDITKKKELQEKNIINAIIQTEEKERANFSKELHDGLGPLLSAIKLYLQWSRRPKSNKSSKEIILKAEEILEEALTTVREISNKLSPHLLSNYGLTAAVQSFVNKLQETRAISIEFDSNLDRRVKLEVEVALYRAIIECVNNTIKYSKADNIYIRINDISNQIQLQYRDDGKGFNIEKTMTENKGLGLFNLQNRIQSIGGEIQMYSKPNKGVNYIIFVPVEREI